MRTFVWNIRVISIDLANTIATALSVCEIGGCQVAQATCKHLVATYFDQLVAIPGDLRFCLRTLRYSHKRHILHDVHI